MMNKKNKIVMLLSVISFFIMSADFLIMPIGNNIDKNMRWFEILTGFLFWLPLIAGVALQIISASALKKNNKVISGSKRCGAISFFRNKISAVFDVVFIVSLILFLAMIIFTAATSYFCYIFIALLTFSFCMHCVLNGKYFNFMLKEEDNKNEKEIR